MCVQVESYEITRVVLALAVRALVHGQARRRRRRVDHGHRGGRCQQLTGRLSLQRSAKGAVMLTISSSIVSPADGCWQCSSS